MTARIASFNEQVQVLEQDMYWHIIQNNREGA